MDRMKLVHGFSAAVLAMSHFFHFGSFQSVEVIKLQGTMANSTVGKSVFELFPALDFLFWQNSVSKNFHEALLAMCGTRTQPQSQNILFFF
jgi:hypothetical protein